MIIRAYRPADLDTLVDLTNAADAVDRVERGMSRAELAAEFSNPLMRPERDVLVVEAEEGRIVGWTAFTLLPEPGGGWMATSRGTVHPEFRRRGIGRELLSAAMGAALARARKTVKDGTPVYFDAGHDLRLPGPAYLFRALGLEPARQFLNMLYPSLDVLPELPAPPGVALCTWGPDLDEGVRDTRNEAFRDHWGAHDLSPEEFDHIFKSGGFDPALWWCALAPAAGAVPRVVGISLSRVDTARNARTGRREGHIRQVAVRRAWRGRGIASALVIASLYSLRDAGMDSAHLGVDADSPTGAQQLYEHLGFCERRRMAIYRKRIL